MATSDGSTATSVAMYMLASSLINKMLIADLPCPFFILACQFGSSAVLARVVAWWSSDDTVKLSYSALLLFMPASIAQVATIFTGIKALQYINVETFIIARACTPVMTSLVEYVFMNHELPSWKSIACLNGMVIGALFYGYHEAFHATDTSYAWLNLWLAFFCLDQTYLKHVLSNTGKSYSTVAGVFNTNLIGAALVIMGARFEATNCFPSTVLTSLLLCLSCLFGMVLATMALATRKLTTPTQFAIIGNTCKLLTVACNWVVWDRHCTVTSLAGLMLSLLSAYYYKPSKKQPIEEASTAQI